MTAMAVPSSWYNMDRPGPPLWDRCFPNGMLLETAGESGSFVTNEGFALQVFHPLHLSLGIILNFGPKVLGVLF